MEEALSGALANDVKKGGQVAPEAINHKPRLTLAAMETFLGSDAAMDANYAEMIDQLRILEPHVWNLISRMSKKYEKPKKIKKTYLDALNKNPILKEMNADLGTIWLSSAVELDLVALAILLIFGFEGYSDEEKEEAQEVLSDPSAQARILGLGTNLS